MSQNTSASNVESDDGILPMESDSEDDVYVDEGGNFEEMRNDLIDVDTDDDGSIRADVTSVPMNDNAEDELVNNLLAPYSFSTRYSLFNFLISFLSFNLFWNE